MIRWLADRWRGKPASEAEAETSPGVLLSSGYIAGGTLIGWSSRSWRSRPRVRDALDLTPVPRRRVQRAGFRRTRRSSPLATFAAIAAILFWIASRRDAARSR